jgi:ubiquinone/menaquinone biosynthesis C-methylase UbiE
LVEAVEGQMKAEIPDYESYDYSLVWRGRDIEDRAEKELVRRWAATSKGKESALDLGGGFGRITRVLEPQFERVYMVDYSLAGLQRAARTLGGKTTLVRCSLERLPFEENAFDFITMVRVMQHIPWPDKLMAEVARVGRPGGTFVLGIANEAFTGYGNVREHTLGWTTPEGHRVYVTPLSRYGSAGMKREEVRGVGAFDNRVGRRLRRLTPLSELDVATAKLWPLKTMLFARFTITKKEKDEEDGATDKHQHPWVICGCGGRIEEGRCGRCGRPHRGRIIDITADPEKEIVAT